jgi:hypothetical protein
MILGSWVGGRQLDKRWNFLVRRPDFCEKRTCNAVMKTKRVAIYVRVSTTEQDTEGQETEFHWSNEPKDK